MGNAHHTHIGLRGQNGDGALHFDILHIDPILELQAQNKTHDILMIKNDKIGEKWVWNMLQEIHKMTR